MKTVSDRGEKTTLMEPLLIGHSSRHRPELTDLALELAQKSAGFRRSLPEGVVSALADLVRAMNCYYSNLIEGHKTHPVDIERAMRENYSKEPRKRDLQLEARAHVTVQRWIDRDGLIGKAATRAGICEIHKRFCELLPDDLLSAEDPDSGERERVEPGALRKRDVKAGNHVAISPGAIPRFLDRIEAVYGDAKKTETLLSVAAAHHRLLWIHPFIDGNGRVARLMSYSMLRDALDAVLYRGELPRGDVPEIVGTGERQARRVVSSLADAGVLQSESSRAPLRIAFPAALAGRWMPGLFPEM